MPDYDDKSYYEVQLEQKQLVLILLLVVAICVLFFFLGVYYARGREPVAANGNARKEAKAAPEGLKAPEGPSKVETEQVSRFFETGGSKEGAAKAEYEGGRVIAESKATDPPKKTPPPKGVGDAAKGEAPGTPKEKPPSPTPKATPTERKEPPPSANGSFIVQVAAMKEVERANKVRNDLVAKGFKAYLDTQDTASGEKLYKIRVGPFTQRTDAEQAKDALRSEGHGSAFVSGE